MLIRHLRPPTGEHDQQLRVRVAMHMLQQTGPRVGAQPIGPMAIDATSLLEKLHPAAHIASQVQRIFARSGRRIPADRRLGFRRCAFDGRTAGQQEQDHRRLERISNDRMFQNSTRIPMVRV